MIGRVAVLAMTAFCIFANQAVADEFPDKPIRFVTTGVGLSTEMVTRVVAKKLTEKFGWKTFVENKPGGNNLIAMRYAASFPGDGYTLVSGVSSLTLLPATTKDFDFDILKELKPITRTANLPVVVYARPDSPAKDLRSLIEWSKTERLTFASQNSGTVTHLAGEMLKSLGLQWQNVPYKDSSGVVDVMAGRVSAGIAPVGTVASQIRNGQLKGVVMLSPKRSAVLPDVSTVAEAGYPAMDANAWISLMAPASTPDSVISMLNKAITSVLELPEVQAELIKMGTEPVAESPEDFRKKIEFDLDFWKKTVQESGYMPQ